MKIFIKILRFILKILNRGILQWLFLRLMIKVPISKEPTKLQGIGIMIGVIPLSGYGKDFKGIFKGKILRLLSSWELK